MKKLVYIFLAGALLLSGFVALKFEVYHEAFLYNPIFNSDESYRYVTVEGEEHRFYLTDQQNITDYGAVNDDCLYIEVVPKNRTVS